MISPLPHATLRRRAGARVPLPIPRSPAADPHPGAVAAGAAEHGAAVVGDPRGRTARRSIWRSALWSAGLMRIFGFRLRRFGTPLPDRGDVRRQPCQLDRHRDAAQPAHDGLRRQAARSAAGRWWAGWRARGETIFHQRGSQESMGGVLHEMLARLQAGRSVGVFPEGRTRDGAEVGPFHARIFLAGGRSRRAGAAGGAALRRARQRADAWSRSAPGKASSPISCACSANRRAAPRSVSWPRSRPASRKAAASIAELARERIVAAMESDR